MVVYQTKACCKLNDKALTFALRLKLSTSLFPSPQIAGGVTNRGVGTRHIGGWRGLVAKSLSGSFVYCKISLHEDFIARKYCYEKYCNG